jgi:lysophospholipase L1-like esterase
MASAGTASITFTGTRADILWYGDTTTGTFSWTVDGGAATNVNTTLGVPADGNVTTIGGLAPGSHTVVISWVSGTVYFGGAMIYNGDENAGIRMWDGGHSGYVSSSFIDAANPRWIDNLKTIKPRLVIIGLGTNDAGGTPVPTFISNMQTLVANVRAVMPAAGTSIVLTAAYPRGDAAVATWTPYYNAVRQIVAADPTLLLFDAQARFGTTDVAANTWGQMNADLIHPSDLGHQLYADALLSVIAPGSSGGSDPATIQTKVGTVSTARETAVSTTTTLTSAALGTSVACTVGSAFTLTLPTPVGVAGQQISVRVVSASTQLLTLATAAGNIDGQSTRIMWAGESATLLSDGTNWVKTAGRTIPMRCSLRMTAAQTLPNGANTTATLDTTTLDNTGLMATLGSNGITVQRPGTYTVLARTGMDQPATNCIRFSSMAQKNGTTIVVEQETFVFAGAFPSFCAVDDITLAAADIVKLQAYQTCTTPVTRNFTTGATAIGTALTVREIPAW